MKQTLTPGRYIQYSGEKAEGLTGRGRARQKIKQRVSLAYRDNVTFW